MRYDCLIVDDEEALSQSTCEYFNMFDVKTSWVKDSSACLNFLGSHEADLILLDINLWSSSGFDLCKKLRQNTDVPILFISARNSDDDMLLALNIGGDDYIQKPYSLSVLLAKVKAVLKRYKNNEVASDTYNSGRLSIDFNSRTVLIDGQDIVLKAMEYKLLTYFIKNKNRVIRTIFAAVAAVILIITVIVVVLVLYLVIKTMILRRKRDFGIQKAVGFTTIQLMNQVALGYTPLISAGVFIGGAGGYFAMNPIFTALVSSMGIMNAHMPSPADWTVATCIALVVLAYVVSMLVAWRIRKISVYALISE